ncbi:MAG: Thermonuclease precursor [Candidatus Atribacteria bacterium ADurb.Bin276]|uniref:Thermonuclease n=1 Tax=Candidatus Atribacter allofermentans TaxID=1852833 RepID=A0A1V5T3X9_9BACT|nr:MAG: Thermonuclease precursor [Candidatus Atribacteria bacterium ADurb.Bin276]
MKKLLFLIILLLPLNTLPCSFDSKVIGVSDGDTITVIFKEHPQKIRIHQIDAPEKEQPFSNKAKQFVSNLIFGKFVNVEIEDVDKYGRIVGEVTLPDGRKLHEELLKSGLAWVYDQYVTDKNLYELQDKAKSEKIGLWADKHALSPWEFRKANPH